MLVTVKQLTTMKTKLIEKTSPLYVRRMVREINKSQPYTPEYSMPGSQFHGRRIIRAWEKDGVLWGRSLNGESWALNVDAIVDTRYNEQLCASREP